MATLSAQVEAAMRRAIADGRSPHHVSLCAGDWRALTLPTVTLTPALKASASVLWAMDAKGLKLVPYTIEAA